MIFKAFCTTDSLCIHEIDHSGLSVATCASSPSDLGGVGLKGLCPRAGSGRGAPRELEEGMGGGSAVTVIPSRAPTTPPPPPEVARGPLVIKAVSGTKRYIETGAGVGGLEE